MALIPECTCLVEKWPLACGRGFISHSAGHRNVRVVGRAADVRICRRSHVRWDWTQGVQDGQDARQAWAAQLATT